MKNRIRLAILLLALATGDWADADKVTLRHLGKIGDGRLRQSRDITSLQLLSDGKNLLTTSEDTSVRLWNLETMKPVSVMQDYDPPTVIRLLPGERQILTIVRNQLHVWDLRKGTKIRTMTTRASPRHVWLQPEKREFMVIDGNAVKVFRWDTGKLARTLGKDKRDELFARTKVSGIPSPTGEPFRVKKVHQGIMMVRTGEKRGVVWRVPVLWYMFPVAWSPDGKFIATTRKDGEIWLLHAKDGSIARKIRIDDVHIWDHMPVTFSADSRLIYSAGTIVHIHEVETGRQLFPARDRRIMNSVAAMEVRGDRLYVMSHDAKGPERDRIVRSFVDEWDLTTKKHRKRLCYRDAMNYTFALTPNGLILTGSGTGEIVATDPATDKIVWKAPNPHPKKNTALGIHFLDEKRFVVTGGEGAYLYKMGSDEAPKPLCKGLVTSFVMSPNKKTFTTGQIGKFRVWDSASGDLIRELAAKTVSRTVWYSGDSSQLLFSYYNKLWRSPITPQGRETKGGLGDFKEVADASLPLTTTGTFSPDQRYWVAISRRGHNVSLSLGHYVNDRPRILTTRVCHDEPSAVAWSKDGRTFYVGNRTGTIDVFRVETQ